MNIELDSWRVLPALYLLHRWGVSRTSTRRWAQEAGIERIHLPRPGWVPVIDVYCLDKWSKMTLPSRAQSAFQGEGVRNLQEVRSFHCLQGTWGGQTNCLQVTTFLVLLMFLKRFCQKVEWAQDRTEGLQNIFPRAQGGSSCQLSQVWTCRDF